jgi:hypothetical protein
MKSELGFPKLLSFHAKSQVLKIHTHKNFKMSHKVKVLGRIYFGIGMAGGGEKQFLLPSQEMRVETLNSGSYL